MPNGDLRVWTAIENRQAHRNDWRGSYILYKRDGSAHFVKVKWDDFHDGYEICAPRVRRPTK